MSHETPLRTFTLFFEGPAGVTESVVGVFEANGATFLKPITVVTASGQPPQVTRTSIHQALKTHEWICAHPEVIDECRVWEQT